MHRRSKVIPSAHYGDCWLSYKLMGKLLYSLTGKLLRVPEHEITRREKLANDIERLRLIRSDMNVYMKTL